MKDVFNSAYQKRVQPSRVWNSICLLAPIAWDLVDWLVTPHLQAPWFGLLHYMLFGGGLMLGAFFSFCFLLDYSRSPKIRAAAGSFMVGFVLVWLMNRILLPPLPVRPFLD